MKGRQACRGFWYTSVMPKRFAAGALSVAALAGAALLTVPGREFARTALHAAGIHRPPAPAGIGDRMPALEVTDLNGNASTLDPSRRGTVVYNIFASWCAPCNVELPQVRAAAALLRGRGIELVGIDQGEEPSTITLFKRLNGVSYPIVIDRRAQTAELLGVRVIPETMIVHDGILRSVIVGPTTTGAIARAAESV
jgi:cytochrome c biogenesis protein CcmG, thiol:disulfide interchange protein DsbE